MESAKIKLSEAIRLGSSLPGYNWWSPQNCAVGKAMEAAGASKKERTGWIAFKKLWPWTEGILVSAPARYPYYTSTDIPLQISHMANKNQGHSVEEIATWIESLEDLYLKREAENERTVLSNTELS